MTTPDRTEELIREMLERRASEPPAWLTEETDLAVRRAPQRAGALSRAPGRIALVAAAAVVMVAGVGGAAIGSGLLNTSVIPSPVPSFDLALLSPSPTPTREPDESPSEAPVEEPTVPAGAHLPADSIAVVTTAGDGLRVRSAPGIGTDSKKLTPLLPKATRMLVLDGPVAADGYDWYQVLADAEGLAGWVAAGNDGAAWIRPGKRRCPGKLDVDALYRTASIDLLLCFQGKQARVVVYGVGDYDGAHCDLQTDRTGCNWTPRWFERQGYVNLGGFGTTPPGEMGAVSTLDVVIDPAVSAEDLASQGTDPTVILSFDHPDARSCRVREDDGRDAMEPWEAVLACRLLPVVEEVVPGEPIDIEEP